MAIRSNMSYSPYNNSFTSSYSENWRGYRNYYNDIPLNTTIDKDNRYMNRELISQQEFKSEEHQKLCMKIKDLEILNDNLKYQLNQVKGDLEASTKRFSLREDNLIDRLRFLEEQKLHFEERLNYFLDNDSYKYKEEQVILENSRLREKKLNLEMTLELLNLFFNKLQNMLMTDSLYSKMIKSSNIQLENMDISHLREKLHRMEEEVSLLVKLKQQYSNKGKENSFNFDNSDSTNKKLKELSLENEILRQRIENLNLNKEKIITDKLINNSVKEILSKEEKTNLSQKENEDHNKNFVKQRTIKIDKRNSQGVIYSAIQDSNQVNSQKEKDKSNNDRNNNETYNRENESLNKKKISNHSQDKPDNRHWYDKYNKSNKSDSKEEKEEIRTLYYENNKKKDVNHNNPTNKPTQTKPQNELVQAVNNLSKKVNSLEDTLKKTTSSIGFYSPEHTKSSELTKKKSNLSRSTTNMSFEDRLHRRSFCQKHSIRPSKLDK